jgi:hypothetical protein
MQTIPGMSLLRPLRPEFDQERHTREALRKILGAAVSPPVGDKQLEAALADGLQALVSGWGERALE